MVKFVQRFVVQLSTISETVGAFSRQIQAYISSTKLYVYPTQNQRFGFCMHFHPEFAYQKVAIGFDNFSIRAIIRDEDFLNGHHRRP